MRDPTLIRGVALFVPLLATLAVAAWRKPDDRAIAAAIVATAWNFATLFALNQVAIRLGWWTFGADGAVAAGVPIDLWLGWSLLWGALPALAPRLPLAGVVAGLGLLDVAFMPFAAPVVRLGTHWLTGELAGLLACLVPALLLADWTRTGRRLWLRVAAQAGLAGGLMFALPLYLLQVDPYRLVLLVPALLPPFGLGLAAAWEFAARGGGTPLPYDPPRRLVTTGPYAWVRNPMQLSMTLSYLVLAAGLADLRLLAGAVFAVSYSAGLAAWHEGERLEQVYGGRWRAYRAEVRPWLPRRPAHKSMEAHARHG